MMWHETVKYASVALEEMYWFSAVSLRCLLTERLPAAGSQSVGGVCNSYGRVSRLGDRLFRGCTALLWKMFVFYYKTFHIINTHIPLHKSLAFSLLLWGFLRGVGPGAGHPPTLISPSRCLLCSRKRGLMREGGVEQEEQGDETLPRGVLSASSSVFCIYSNADWRRGPNSPSGLIGASSSSFWRDSERLERPSQMLLWIIVCQVVMRADATAMEALRDNSLLEAFASCSARLGRRSGSMAIEFIQWARSATLFAAAEDWTAH